MCYLGFIEITGMEETPKSPQSPQSPSGSSNSSDSTSSSSSSERTISTGSPDALNLLGSLEPSNLSTTDVSNYASTDSDSDSLNTRELRNYEVCSFYYTLTPEYSTMFIKNVYLGNKILNYLHVLLHV